MAARTFRAALVLLTGRLVHATKVSSESGSPVAYTTDPLCIQHNCVNPVMPALEEFGSNVLTEYSTKPWNCLEGRLIDPDADSKTVFLRANLSSQDRLLADGGATIKTQMQRAVNSYVAHLMALGKDFFDYKKPWDHDECIQAIWKLSCYTHFPRCSKKTESYLRPCVNTCTGYLNQCKVNCCDEGTSCVFHHKRKLADGSFIDDEGYANHDGPSPLCTGDYS
eukprot:TRINITY_DN12904_c0_g1_i1.p1 TRINITY_DN12904_c0_g1~~TRINITY_DN12904_c0_g1_i1.p1  ORF type:complete len:235 (+),score=25.84 TRINITY_DN12904_c0_g1_i1:37-705(+)